MVNSGSRFWNFPLEKPERANSRSTSKTAIGGGGEERVAKEERLNSGVHVSRLIPGPHLFDLISARKVDQESSTESAPAIYIGFARTTKMVPPKAPMNKLF